jgi:superfamily II DNA or RNA helicase
MNKEQEQLIQKYNIKIYEIVKNKLDNSGKNIDDFDYKTDLHKIFEYFSCIKLTQEYNTPFHEYEDIKSDYKELNCMSKNDTGIDACNLIDMIVQCKLRQQSLTWKECSTFFGSNLYADSNGKSKTRWDYLIITRNQESKLADHLNEKLKFNQFIDKTYPRTEIISYCKDLIENPPEYFTDNTTIEIRDYQKECIKEINDMNGMNLIICLPTGTGKNFIITHSLQSNVKYLIMVPRIILMEQIKDEIIKYHPRMKSKIQLIGDSNSEFKTEKDITICVYNSVGIIKDHIELFDKIFVDEAHHIRKPEIYKDEDDSYSSSDMDSDDEDASYSDEEYFDDEYFDEEEIEDEYDDDDEPRKQQKEEIKKEIKEEDDLENENCDNKSFIQIIREFSKLNNNVYLSATIDKRDDFKFYQKDIREMIEKGYLCDYTINIPIFAEDPTNISVCKYLIKNHHNIIVYCNSQKDGKSINKIMNSIMKGCSEYIDCNTSKKKRNDIINNYKSGKLPFLVNVRILVEGFDSPITNGVCFMSLPSSGTTLIQIIGRALRLDPKRGKTMAKVILPFSKKEDEKAIKNFMQVIAKNDSRIRKSYENKKLGGYLDLENVFDEETFNDNSDLMNDVELKYELIFNSIGELKNIEEIWMKKLEEVKKYIDENKNRPSGMSKDKRIKILGIWLQRQLYNYKTNKDIMKNDTIYSKFKDFLEFYKEYFLSNEEVWNNNLNKVIQYIDENNELPSTREKNKEIKYIGIWLSVQKRNYKIHKQIMKDNIIYNKFKDFLESYKKYFITYEEIWNNNLEKIIQYIKENNKLPSQTDKNKEIKTLGSWINTQKINYKTNKTIMKNDRIYNKFKDFLETYKNYLLTNEEVWNNNLEKVIKYIKENDKLPSNCEEDKEIQYIGYWLQTQKTNFKSLKKIMKYDIIYNKFKKFLELYKDYFTSNEEVWNNNLEKVIQYIKENKKLPYDKEIKSLGQWVSTQKRNYKKRVEIMKNDIIYNKFKDFLETYSEYFISNTEVWNYNLKLVIKYIEENNKMPSSKSKDKEINFMGCWINTQKINYKTKKNIMKDDLIYNKFKDFLEEYKDYLLSNEEIWNNNLEKVIQYIKENNKLPSHGSKNKEIQYLGSWLSSQKNNYKTKSQIMLYEEIYNKFKDFLETYKEYFISNEEVWNNNLELVIKYINDNKKIPSSSSKNKEIKTLGNWLSSQKTNYKIREQIMKDDLIYNEWTKFIDEYKEYLLSNEECWNNNLEKVIEYITKNNNIPYEKDKNKEIKALGYWISYQKQNYKLKKNIMKEELIYNEWTNFIKDDKYKSYFIKENDE